MTSAAPAPLDARQRAIANALGHLLAELVWRSATGPPPGPSAAEKEARSP